MSFLAPLFFAGLAALAIPVLIHLIQRERKNVVQFPSLMFVRRIPYSSIRRRRIHNWALLAMRLAALALIVAAFARPFFATPAVGGGRRRARCRDPAGPLVQHGPRRSVGPRARAPPTRRWTGRWRSRHAGDVRDHAEVAVQPTNDRRAAVRDQRTQLSAGATRSVRR